MHIANSVCWRGTFGVAEMYDCLTFENPTDRTLTGFARSDGWRDMTRLLVAFRNCFSNALKIPSLLHREHSVLSLERLISECRMKNQSLLTVTIKRNKCYVAKM